MPLGAQAPASKPAWITVAEGEIGVREDRRPGKHNPRIVEYHDSCTLHAKDDETPWCSAFVNWCMEQANVPRTKSALARSWLNWGIALDEPEYGCVVVLSRGNDPRFGHVGFVVGWDSRSVKVLAGNQTRKSGEEFDSVNVRAFPRSKVVGFRKPRPISNSTTVKAAGSAGTATIVDKTLEAAGPSLPAPTEVLANPDVVNTLSMAQVATGVMRVVLVGLVLLAVAYIVRERYLKWKENGQ